MLGNIGVDGREILINRYTAFECKLDSSVSIQGPVVVFCKPRNTYSLFQIAGIF
jgi:hypothetical protein